MSTRGKGKRAARELSASQPSSRDTADRAAKRAAIGGGVPSEEREARLNLQIEERAFWDTIATSHLFAWATDYDTPLARKLKPDDRIGLLNFLVETEGVAIPDGNLRSRHEQLRKCWRKRNSKGAAVPDVLAAPPAAAAVASPGEPVPDLSGGNTPPLNQLARAEPDEETDDYDLHAHTVTAAARGFAPLPANLAAQFALAGAHTPSPLAASPRPLRACLACNAPTAQTGVFTCGECHLRGDLAIDHPYNTHLLKLEVLRIEGHASPTVSSAAAAGSSSGQPAAASLKSADRLSAWDSNLARITAAGVDVPLFTGPDAAAGMTARDALARVARAFDAARFAAPSDQLLAAIRAGKLRDVGFALPRTHAAVQGIHETEAGTLSLGADGVPRFTNKAKDAPPVSSAQAFTTALISTILPALIDRPAALVEWLTLGRTVLALDERYGWANAFQYAQRQLALCIDEGKPFATETAASVLLPIALAAGPGGAGRGPAAPGSQQAQRSNTGPQTCHNFNNGVPCRLSPCKFAHSCQNCQQLGHGSSSCPNSQQQQSSRRGPARAGNSGSSVASKTTRPTSASAASSAASGAPHA